MALEFLASRPMGLRERRGDGRQEERGRRRRRPARDGLSPRGLRPVRSWTRESIENAIAGVNASGGSTNAVLHLSRSRARRRAAHDRRLRSDREAHTVWADLQPGGPLHRRDLGLAGGTACVSKRLSTRRSRIATPSPSPAARSPRRAGRVRGPWARTSCCRSRSDQADRRPRHPERLAPRPTARRQDRRHAAEDAPRPGAHLRARGGRHGRRPRGRDRGRGRRRHPLRGAARRPRMREMLASRGDRGRRPRRQRRALTTAASAGRRAASWPERGARGVRRRADRVSSRKATRSPRRGRAPPRSDVPASVLAERRARWKRPAARYTSGVLAKYAALVSSAPRARSRSPE